MNTALQAFAFDSHAVHVVMKDDAPWFVAKDVCNCIGIVNHRVATSKLDADEKGVYIIDTLGGPQQTVVVNESGLYAIILRSDGAMNPGTPAHAFRKWVTAEVLPSIRKTGSYAAPGSTEAKIDRLLALLEAHLALTTRALTPKPKRAPHRPVMPEEIQRARELKAEGMSGNEIARQLQRSTATVSWMVREGRP
ncbi:MAG: hypothetical protein LBE62_12960 [Azonexus sp.]|jgi:prophage antirepressor-like protein|nr:hypothetical protein [Azonexus sp.]